MSKITIDDIVAYVDDLKQNAIAFEIKHEWVAALERELRSKIISEYTAAAPPDDELCAAPLYKDIYRWYLEAMIDDAHGETQKYNNSAAKYNTARVEFAAYYNRTHERRQSKRRHFI